MPVACLAPHTVALGRQAGKPGSCLQGSIVWKGQGLTCWGPTRHFPMQHKGPHHMVTRAAELLYRGGGSRARKRTMGAKNHSPVTTDTPPPISLPNDHSGPTTLTVLCCFRRLIKEAGSAMSHQTKTGRALQPRRPICPQTEVSLPGPGPEAHHGCHK